MHRSKGRSRAAGKRLSAPCPAQSNTAGRSSHGAAVLKVFRIVAGSPIDYADDRNRGSTDLGLSHDRTHYMMRKPPQPLSNRLSLLTCLLKRRVSLEPAITTARFQSVRMQMSS